MKPTGIVCNEIKAPMREFEAYRSIQNAVQRDENFVKSGFWQDIWRLDLGNEEYIIFSISDGGYGSSITLVRKGKISLEVNSCYQNDLKFYKGTPEDLIRLSKQINTKGAI